MSDIQQRIDEIKLLNKKLTEKQKEFEIQKLIEKSNQIHARAFKTAQLIEAEIHEHEEWSKKKI